MNRLATLLLAAGAAALMGCSVETAAGQQASPVNADAGTVTSCQPNAFLCDSHVLSDDAVSRATWAGYLCPPNVQPDVPNLIVADAGVFFGCDGWWVPLNDYKPTDNWQWCCPIAAR